LLLPAVAEPPELQLVTSQAVVAVPEDTGLAFPVSFLVETQLLKAH
jgi:hypothetical protein